MVFRRLFSCGKNTGWPKIFSGILGSLAVQFCNSKVGFFFVSFIKSLVVYNFVFLQRILEGKIKVNAQSWRGLERSQP